jgi:hypothetical protein
MDEIGRNYLTLALNLNRHFEGFVDAYFGPPELKAEVDAGQPRPLDALAEDAGQLQQAIEDSGYDPQRKDFLTRQTRAMIAVIRNLSGDQLDFVEEVELYFDITPEMVDEEIFEAILAEVDRLLPGDGSLPERVAAWEKRLLLEPDRILPVCNLALQEARRRTRALFDLPLEEEVSLNLVENQSWAGYNWYLGRYQSRIDVNSDVPVRADDMLEMAAHEAYPGHHTEQTIKEYHLYRQEGRAEHAILLLLGPEAVLSEGIAMSAQGLIFSDEELAAFLGDELYPLAGLPDVEAEQPLGVARARIALRAVMGNAALLLHRDGWPADEVEQYAQRYALRGEQEVARLLKFIQTPLFRSYTFNYTMGKEMLASLLEGPDATANFARLLSEPFTPTLVREWVAQSGRIAETGHPGYNL